jgi:UDP-2,3-diacylglucosamine pyrophosphatase LpxH
MYWRVTLRKIRSVFISDTHLGCKHSKTKELLEFLQFVDKNRPEYVYLVGDIIDGWKINTSWHWNHECNLILRKIFSLLKHNTKIIYIAGNHDEFLRNFMNLEFSDISIKDEVVHITPNGDKILVIHGDKFDTAVRYAMKYTKFLCKFGDWSYEKLMNLNSILNYFRKKLGMSYWSASRAIKGKFKDAVKYIGGFEQVLSDYAKEKDCMGVICGHIHTPEIKLIGETMYYNCGDFVESVTALIEYDSGEIELVNIGEK